MFPPKKTELFPMPSTCTACNCKKKTLDQPPSPWKIGGSQTWHLPFTANLLKHSLLHPLQLGMSDLADLFGTGGAGLVVNSPGCGANMILKQSRATHI